MKGAIEMEHCSFDPAHEETMYMLEKERDETKFEEDYCHYIPYEE